jgi:GNAT superfamily N-acetyltransferase
VQKEVSRYNNAVKTSGTKHAGSGIRIRRFRPGDQTAAKVLILEGLREHWGTIDPGKNPDLDDIAAAYAGGVFRVAVAGGRIIGTGALVLHGNGEAEIRRMSVVRALRRRGVGGALLRRLIEDARSAGCRRIILETTAAWEEAAAFYLRRGFRKTHRRDGDQFFLLELNPGPASMV